MYVSDLFKLLSDSTRLRVLMLLREAPLCVSQMQAILGLPQSNLSKHLAKLRDAQLVETQQDGKYIKYQLAFNPFLHAILYEIKFEGKEEQFIIDLKEFEKNDFQFT